MGDLELAENGPIGACSVYRIGRLEPGRRGADRGTVRERAAAAKATELGGPSDEERRTGAMVGSHLLYGAAAGAFYGLAQHELRQPVTAAGLTYGLAVWLASYVGWLPAARILPEPWRQDTGDAQMPVAAHAVYGPCLGRLTEQIDGACDEPHTVAPREARG